MTDLYQNDLQELDDITNDFNEIAVFSMEEEVHMHNTALIMIDEYINSNIKTIKGPGFALQLEKEVFDLMYLSIANAYDFDIETELRTCVIYALSTYYKCIMPKRECKGTFIRAPPNMNIISNKIELLRNKPQPEQRSQAWYEFRHTLVTASAAWQALDSQCNINHLICEKCKPITVHANTGVNTTSPFHWGIKYEEVSVMLYEDKYRTKVDDYGCIQHDTYKFLGASPDGINTCKKTNRYGRMLEIKNIVNRDITGIPKKEYWIQMQLQMETCNLNECDFLETRFKEYENKEAFDSDGTFNKTAKNMYKGIILYFLVDNKPYYEYCPLKYSNEEITTWEQEMMKVHVQDTWVQNLYWYLDELSCVLVLRNKTWFNAIIGDISDVWDIILKERVSGYEHRLPKRRINKASISTQNSDVPTKGICLVKLNSETDNAANTDITIKINTE